jgi:UDP-N-acetyl-D-glucosamine dehydrogenase
VDYNDPHIVNPPKTRRYRLEKGSVPLTADNLARYDCVVVATDHSAYDPSFIVEKAHLVIDTRNLVKSRGDHQGKVVRA